MTHLRDVYFEHTIEMDVDPSLVDALEEERLVEKAFDVLEEDVGGAAKWFEHDRTDGTDVTFELCVKRVHSTDVDDEKAREMALELAVEMFDREDSPFDPHDLAFVEVVDPEDDSGDSPTAQTIDDNVDDSPAADIDNSTDIGTDNGENTEDALTRALGNQI